MTKTPPFHKLLDNGIGADFVFTASISGSTFPLDTEARIEVYDTDNTTILDTFDGTYDTTSFSWAETSTTMDALPDRPHYRCYVKFPNTPDDYLWFYGTLRRIG
ncbi:DUF7264 domain-containing protein [Nocardia vulneris]|uniref:LtfC/p132/Gp6 beta-sandwich domain-containing protein n=1 Tax=Nocardia vulneris TaxID=1141657 RepID=A0ABR4ZCN1_9NOCA|nr:hypothetical protein [Nocardia vulneris]KIA62993.1 hypothetical protein FG87_21670 [Nocardia vulneris]